MAVSCPTADFKAAPPEESPRPRPWGRWTGLFWRLYVPSSVPLTFALVSPVPEPVKETISYILLAEILLGAAVHLIAAANVAATSRLHWPLSD